ncbi:hypothetical protein NDU88_007355 [Pleurodeles waltl]|uniref:Uncharacterized protein n=1 Tax=Pleurodeles waltl TaxID=8319 RepID=A0AAV7RUP9_PLEWA|nr:hypothetical protein NDU88_007355 [Pleurodeles waltl]
MRVQVGDCGRGSNNCAPLAADLDVHAQALSGFVMETLKQASLATDAVFELVSVRHDVFKERLLGLHDKMVSSLDVGHPIIIIHLEDNIESQQVISCQEKSLDVHNEAAVMQDVRILQFVRIVSPMVHKVQRTVRSVQNRIGFLQPRTAGVEAGHDNCYAMSRVEEQASSQRLEQTTEKVTFPLGVEAPLVGRPGVMMRPRAACLMTQEQAGATSEVLGGMISIGQPSTSWSNESVLHWSGLEEKILDYDEGGGVEEGELVDDVDTHLGNVQVGGVGLFLMGGALLVCYRRISLKTVQHDRKGGSEEKKHASVYIPRGEKKGVSGEGAFFICFVSVAAGNSPGNTSALGVSSLGGKDIYIQTDIEGEKNTVGKAAKSYEVITDKPFGKLVSDEIGASISEKAGMPPVPGIVVYWHPRHLHHVSDDAFYAHTLQISVAG